MVEQIQAGPFAGPGLDFIFAKVYFMTLPSTSIYTSNLA